MIIPHLHQGFPNIPLPQHHREIIYVIMPIININLIRNIIVPYKIDFYSTLGYWTPEPRHVTNSPITGKTYPEDEIKEELKEL